MKPNTVRILFLFAAPISIATAAYADQPGLAEHPTARYHGNGSGSSNFWYDVDPRYNDPNETDPKKRTKIADVRDFHVCMAGAPDDMDADKLKAVLDMGKSAYPKDWTWTVAKDESTGRWCVNFYRGTNGAEVTKTTRFEVAWNSSKRPNPFKFNGGDDTNLVVTNSGTAGETNFQNSTLYNSAAMDPSEKIRGPELASVNPAPSSSTAAGGRLVLTGTVTSGAPATASVMGPDGLTLSGVVVDINGEQHVTDSKGRIVFAVAAGATTLLAVLPGHAGSAVRVPVVSASATTAAAPAVQSAPTFVASGQTFPISGTSFSGSAAEDTVKMGGQGVDVLASSPGELVVAAPAHGTPGKQDLTVTTSGGSSQPRPITLVNLRLESKSTALRTGQKGEARLVVEGTNEPLKLTVTNLAPQTVALSGGSTTQVRTSGGADNHAQIHYRALSPGEFQINTEIAKNK